MKKITSFLLALLMIMSASVCVFAEEEKTIFSDVEASDYYAEAAAALKELNILSGYPDGTFGAEKPITRAEMAAIVCRMIEKEADAEKAKGETAFEDVAADHWASGYINVASAEKIINGDGNGKFRPADNVKHEEAIKMIVCALGYGEDVEIDANDWSKGYLEIAGEKGISEGLKGEKGKASTRGDVAVMTHNGISVKAIEEAPEIPAAPVASKQAGTYTGTQKIALTTETEDAEIYYTLDGTEPTAESTKYTKEISVSKTTTIKAIAIKNGVASEDILNNKYIIKESIVGVTTAKTTKYSLSFGDIENGTVDTSVEGKYKKNTVVSLSATPDENYVFVKWESNKGGVFADVNSANTTFTMPAKKVVITAVFAPATTYTVSFDLNYYGAVNIPETQTVNKDEFALRPENPERSGFQFVGWFLDKEEADWKNTFDFRENKINSNTTLFALWVDITTDTDGDNLSDELEQYVGTDITKIDTDGDGLSDYQEVVELGTNPLKADTDNNGVSDYDEDQDNDTLSNGYEYSIGTNPANKDSDNDSLDDNDEINIYNTSPIKSDTDGDGATDDWELDNNFDPKVANSSFEVSQSSEELSAVNLVAASVDVELNGEQVNTLSITPVSVADNPYISASIPGYLGNAYDFSVDGNISSATLTFEYDSSIGTIGEDFQPRIYYFNEESKEFEELENQMVENGKVVATTSHFSTYILLNKVEFEEVWNTEIKPPIADEDGSEATIDITFVIDYSASMDWNDSDKLFKPLSKEFVSKLRDGKDKAAVVKFIRRATLVSELTTDKEQLNSAIDSIYYDSGYGTYSGTDGSAGYKMALDALSTSDSKYKYIILITDGEDNGYSYDYDDLIVDSVENNIVVYTIGMGSASESVLRKIAQGTNGKYYHATTGTASGDIIDLDKVFEDIQEETVDKTTDTNNDGIPDYYTELIKNGSLVLSNGSDEFSGIDFNYDGDGVLSADYDGDGLKNGEEIHVVQRGTRVYLVMTSNPMMEHSDRDGIDDKTEVRNGTDPLIYQIYNGNAKQLYSDDYYYYASAVENFDNDWLWKADTAFLAGVFGVWNKDELYRDIMIDYFANYADNSYVEGLETEQTRKTMIETLSALISNIKTYGTAPYGEIKKITQLISKINGTSDTKTIHYLLFSTYKEIIEEVIEINPKLGEVKITTYSMKSQTLTLINLNAINDKIGKACKVISYVSYGLDIADTISSFSKVSANAQAFENNIDILQEIKDNSSDDHAKDAASAIMNKLAGSYGNEVLALGGDVLEIAGKELISALSKANVYVLAVVAVRDGIDIITGISKDLKQHYQMICYDRMTTAIGTLFDNIVTNKGNYYYVSDDNIENLNRYLINLAQLRILGEKKYCEWQEDEGMIGWFTDNSDVEKKINEQISAIKGLINSLGLQISAKL